MVAISWQTALIIMPLFKRYGFTSSIIKVLLKENSSEFKMMAQLRYKSLMKAILFIRAAYAVSSKNQGCAMRELWLDIGNTRLKYWITEDQQVIEHAAELHLQSPSDLLLGLIQHFKSLDLSRVGVSSVQDKK